MRPQITVRVDAISLDLLLAIRYHEFVRFPSTSEDHAV